LSVDAIDSSGEQQFAVEHNIFKKRLDLEGKALQEPELDTINKNYNTTTESITSTESTKLEVCKSCYGNLYSKDILCN
jgi:hypothetical protein